LSFQDDREGQRRRRADPDSEPIEPTMPRNKKKRTTEGPVGDALRSAYQRVVNEDVPPEMLDLLGKLG
jgi:hypothetical protein